MKKYFYIARNTWRVAFAYRLSFLIWRIRNVVQYLLAYLFWIAVIPSNSSVLGYTQNEIITYTFGSMIVVSIVFSTLTPNIASEINEGKLSQYLLQPTSYIKFWFGKDIADKALNILFSVIELSILFFLLHPPVFLQTQLVTLFLSLLTICLAVILYFFFSIILSLYGFWSNESWGVRFIFQQLVSFLSGAIFPLDMLPKPIFGLFQALPFPYMLFFPLKVYMGELSSHEIMIGLLVMVFWIQALYLLTYGIWRIGLRSYTAQGN